ncbi:MAG: TetR/AcrR family transcriptional regulator [Desulfurivibrionaceae bacterium]
MPPKKNTQIRRKEIVQAALQIIGEKGVHALTITEIAGRAGMSDANIYRHFKGKQEILEALGDFISEAVMGKAAGIAAGNGSTLEKLSVIFRSHAALIAANPGLPRFIFSEEIHLGDPQLAKTIAGKMAGYIETLSTVIAAGIKTGELRSSLFPRETATTLLGMIQFTALRWSITRGAFSLDAEAERLWNNFLRLIQAASSPTPTETNPMEPV